ncbi:MAG: carbohydrate ABC transporter permease [Oscillospiraceae bacterium]|nr:carbohydrate ABC transporter permease [Oscillospiraceae bacterium]
MKNSKMFITGVHIFFIMATVVFLAPVLIVIAVSISNENDIMQYGFSLIPRSIDFTAYQIILKDFTVIGRAILLTASVAVVGTILALTVNSLLGYVLTKPDFIFRKPITLMLIGSMLFNAGLIPTFVINTRVYHFGNNILVYLLPGLGGAWAVILFRTFFSGISPSLMESAYIDGANELQIMAKIVLPMSKAIYAIQFFMGIISRWNNFQTSLLYMTDEKLYTIQYVLQRNLTDAKTIKQAYEAFGMMADINIPIMTMRYAICLIGILPVLLLFPLMQKFFSKGIAVGSVKE